MLTSMNYIDSPISFIAESITDGIKLGIIKERLDKSKSVYTLIIENNQMKGIKIYPEILIDILTRM